MHADHATELHEILYVSTLADSAPLRVVADIAAHSRQSNHQRGITGLLVFDGMHFCQFFEGSAQAVERLMQRIHHDPRHIRVSVLHQGPVATRRFGSFSLGFTSVDDVEVLERLQRLQGEAALQAFVALLPKLDVNG